MVQRDFLTENQVIQGVENYLKQKGCTSHKRVICKADAKKKEHDVDLAVKLENERKNRNWYFIEAKGNLKADGSKMKSSCSTNFRWVLSQIILRIEVDPTRIITTMELPCLSQILINVKNLFKRIGH